MRILDGMDAYIMERPLLINDKVKNLSRWRGLRDENRMEEIFPDLYGDLRWTYEILHNIREPPEGVKKKDFHNLTKKLYEFFDNNAIPVRAVQTTDIEEKDTLTVGPYWPVILFDGRDMLEDGETVEIIPYDRHKNPMRKGLRKKIKIDNSPEGLSSYKMNIILQMDVDDVKRLGLKDYEKNVVEARARAEPYWFRLRLERMPRKIVLGDLTERAVPEEPAEESIIEEPPLEEAGLHDLGTPYTHRSTKNDTYYLHLHRKVRELYTMSKDPEGALAQTPESLGLEVFENKRQIPMVRKKRTTG